MFMCGELQRRVDMVIINFLQEAASSEALTFGFPSCERGPACNREEAWMLWHRDWEVKKKNLCLATK